MSKNTKHIYTYHSAMVYLFINVFVCSYPYAHTSIYFVRLSICQSPSPHVFKFIDLLIHSFDFTLYNFISILMYMFHLISYSCYLIYQFINSYIYYLLNPFY